MMVDGTLEVLRSECNLPCNTSKLYLKPMASYSTPLMVGPQKLPRANDDVNSPKNKLIIILITI